MSLQSAADAAARAELHTERVEAVRALLEARGADGGLFTARRTFAWLTAGGLNHVAVGTDSGAVPLLVTGDAAVALAPVNEAARIADEELGDLPIELDEVPWERPGAIDDAVRRRVVGRVLRDADLEDDLADRREQLAPLEHGRMRELAADVDRVLDEELGAVRAGTTEDEVAGRIAGRLLASGVRAPVLLAAADRRIDRYRHPLPAGRAVTDRLMLVVVGERHGLHVAVTRFAELRPPSAAIAARDAATRQVLDAMARATLPGTSLDEVLEIARSAYAEAGFADEWQLHHQGGTIGYASRERIATPGDGHRLQPGMAVAWNPSITGAKAEATLIVTEGEAEHLLG